ncbi:MazG family protein [Nakamurella alba]|uniref:MazG family protein n=1 Tax=Nakamurella alba TaxID=2665158 RepID=UPI002AC3191B|nr:MazG family protein [Nakamurella alba]
MSETNGLPGDGLRRAVEVMDRLRSPGGCPWDAEQTHASLGRYLVEECYELLQAIEDQDERAIREELGDVLLQVLFHARIAAETPSAEGGFDIDDVAGDLADKLIRRHPHVYADAEAVDTAADQQVRWVELKKAEGRSSVLSGVALGQPAVALAAKLGARSVKYGVQVPLPAGDSMGEQLFRLAYEAGATGGDPESELRAVARGHADRLVAAERSAPTGTTG